ncbi:hypothetical protein [Pseudoalteromonas ruthenica]|uniref:hypothetical protein n=1 Tax=Pseudoalteromonas ruthenica TaxID=151081 RepID=UPI00110A1751|nr:hypothetical protein [Pseudoalteromonas ruthenica]TMO87722.1 hypothetical protein CWC12_10615 [Pseudoalteromonas ruthenica]TMP21527.1 hypothetical protein CWC06_18440 [Pseudoalteromonas ruthenica]
MRVAENTIKRKRKILELLVKGEKSIKELSVECDIADSQVVYKLIKCLKDDHGFSITERKETYRGEGFCTRRSLLSISKADKERALNICDDELGKRLKLVQDVEKITVLAQQGYNADQIAERLDKTRITVIHIARNNDIKINRKRSKNTPCKPTMTAMDRLTIYRPLA